MGDSEMNLSHLLSAGERRSPEKVALTTVEASGATRTWTYTELFSRARRIATILRHRGCRKAIAWPSSSATGSSSSLPISH